MPARSARGKPASPTSITWPKSRTLVAEATAGHDAELIAAALLHDVVEDTRTTLVEVEAVFGADVAGLVAEATDDKSLPKEERKRLQVLHAAGHSQRAKKLKLADKTSNLRALAASPPADWSIERRRDYVAWGRAVVAGLRGADPWLEERFDDAALAADAALGR